MLSDNKRNELYLEYATAYATEDSTLKHQHARFLHLAKMKSKRYYDRKANPQIFNKDDYIYLLKELLRGKFNKQYKGSYKILEILGNNNVKLAISDNGEELCIVIS